MSSEQRLLNLAGQIYSAASDAKLWPATLESLAGELRADGASLEIHNFRTAGSRFVYSFNIGLTKEYEDYYASKNILYARGASQMTEGNIVTHDMLCPLDEYPAERVLQRLLASKQYLPCIRQCRAAANLPRSDLVAYPASPESKFWSRGKADSAGAHVTFTKRIAIA